MSFGVLNKTARILMEGTPHGLEIDKLCDAIQSLDGVTDLHHIHVWELDEHHRAFEGHIVVNQDRLSEAATIRKRIRQILKTDFEIDHATLELEESSETGTNSERHPKH